MTAFWTKHDFDAANDPKMMRLLAAHKYEGYGYFWRIIEMLGASSDHTLKLDDCESIAYAMHTECERINVFILDCIDYGLFTETNGVFWSNRLCDELMEIDKKSTQGRDAANIRWEKYRQKNADAMPTHSERNASRVEQSRVKKNKEDKNKDSSQQAAEPIKYDHVINILFKTKNGDDWNMPEGYYDKCHDTFQSIDVDQQLKNAQMWLESNPAKRKTAGGMTKFINGWLNRAKPAEKTGDEHTEWLLKEMNL